MPLLFDMSFERLQTYTGRNPRPDDFDAYWDQALAEMHALDPQIEVIPADFQTPYVACSHLYFSGVGGARVHAKLLQPKQATNSHPAVVVFHGYSGNAGDWIDHLAYAGLGFTVAALDCRGQGGRSEDKGAVQGWTLRGHIIRGLDDAPEKLYYRQVFLDTAQLARIVMDLPGVDPDRVGATGRSQGGGLTLACAALEPRIKRAAPVFPFLCDYQRVWEIDQAKDAYAELKEYFRRFDPTHERAQAIWTRLGYVDAQHLAPRIQAEVLHSVALSDTVCPPSSQFAAYNKIRSPKSQLTYPDFGHENLPGNQDAVFQFMAGL